MILPFCTCRRVDVKLHILSRVLEIVAISLSVWNISHDQVLIELETTITSAKLSNNPLRSKRV